jgi:phosphatidate cytidylyltransferase
MSSKFNDLKARFLIYTFEVLVLILVVYFSQVPAMKVVVMLVVVAFGLAAIWEYVEFLKTKKILLPFKLLGIFTALMIFTNYLQILNYAETGTNQMMLGLFFFAIFIYYFTHVDEAIVHIATSFFGIVYILVPLSLMVRILYPESIVTGALNGRIWLTYLIMVTKMTDMGGYFLGKSFGKSKLAPNISPGKTRVGSIAGFIFAVVVSMIFSIAFSFFPELGFQLSLPYAILLGAAIGIFGQIGDLAESLLKRDAKVKDSNSLPGVGGVLDNLDSLLFTAPIVYIFIKNM